MTFVRTDSTAPVRVALVQRIADRLQNDMPVLFLVSGGSTASIAVETCDALAGRFAAKPDIPARLLTVSLIDERFGYEGHPDSNWRLLLEKGFHPHDFLAMPLLENCTGTDAELSIATSRFNAFLTEAAELAARGKLFIAGLLGIGTDGHTAGILPDSPASALSVHAPGTESRIPFASGYKAPLFTRITISPAFFPHIGFAAVYATGSAKWPVLANLERELPVREQPAQLLKLAKETLIFSDRIPGQQGNAE